MMLATIQDLANRLGQTLTAGSPDYIRAEANLQDASALVTAATRPWAPGDDIPDIVKTVTLQSAKRTFLNPTGASQRTMGPFTEGYSGQDVGSVYLTDAELTLLSAVAETTGGLVSVPTRRVGEYGWHWLRGWAHDQYFPETPPFPYFAEEDAGIWDGPC